MNSEKKSSRSNPWAYVSIDIETTGLDPDKNQVIQFGAVLDNFVTAVPKLPSFERLVVNPKDEYVGSAYALGMNGWIFEKIREINLLEPDQTWCYHHQLAAEFCHWITSQGWPADEPLLCAGKNFASFDRQFLLRLPNWKSQHKMHHRTLDPGSMYYEVSDWNRPPCTENCCRRAGVIDNVTHDALDDAFQVVQLIRGIKT